MEHESDGDTNHSWWTWNDLKGLVKGLKDVEIRGKVETIQITAISKSNRILRRAQET